MSLSLIIKRLQLHILTKTHLASLKSILLLISVTKIIKIRQWDHLIVNGGLIILPESADRMAEVGNMIGYSHDQKIKQEYLSDSRQIRVNGLALQITRKLQIV